MNTNDNVSNLFKNSLLTFIRICVHHKSKSSNVIKIPDLTYTIESKQKKKNVHHFVVDIETHKDIKENPDLFQFETEVTQNVKITDFKIKQVSV